MQLRLRCEYLEEVKKSPREDPLINYASMRNQKELMEMREEIGGLRGMVDTLEAQLGLAKEELIKAKAMEEKRGNISAEAYEIRRNLEQLATEKERLTIDLIRVSEQ